MCSSDLENGLSKLLRNRKLIVDFIVSKPVHRAAQQRFLTFELSNGLCVLIRQPGEYRNLRMSHSVGNQDLLPL